MFNFFLNTSAFAYFPESQLHDHFARFPLQSKKPELELWNPYLIKKGHPAHDMRTGRYKTTFSDANQLTDLAKNDLLRQFEHILHTTSITASIIHDKIFLPHLHPLQHPSSLHHFFSSLFLDGVVS